MYNHGSHFLKIKYQHKTTHSLLVLSRNPVNLWSFWNTQNPMLFEYDVQIPKLDNYWILKIFKYLETNGYYKNQISTSHSQKPDVIWTTHPKCVTQAKASWHEFLNVGNWAQNLACETCHVLSLFDPHPHHPLPSPLSPFLAWE